MKNASLLARARSAALELARQGGFFDRIARSAWRTRRVVVLCYHGVSLRDEHEWHGLYVSERHLARRFERLRALGCTVLSLSEALQRQQDASLPERTVVLTFDDGTADFYAKAYPLLREFKLPATLYQTTWYVGRPYPVFDTASSYLLWQARGRSVKLPWLSEETTVPMATSDRRFVALHAGLMRTVEAKKLDGAAKHSLLEEIAESTGVDLESLTADRLFCMMTEDELNALDGNLVDIQLHTHRHRTPDERDAFRVEISDNRAALTRIVRRNLDLRHMCYPSGRHRPVFARWLREDGIDSAVTCDPGVLASRDDRMFIPRFIDTPSTPDVIFDSWITGAAQFLPGRSRK